MLNTIVQVISFVFLMLGSFFFGYAGKPTEMGLCILAGALSLAFANIDKISKFKGAGFEAEMRDKVEAMVAKEAEPSTDREAAGIVAIGYSLDEEAKQVLKCLGNSKYTWRSVSGMSKEAGLSASTVRRSVQWLSRNALVVQAGLGKQVNWGLTEEGRHLFNAVFPAQSDA